MKMGRWGQRLEVLNMLLAVCQVRALCGLQPSCISSRTDVL
jgi:hypothetical protein